MRRLALLLCSIAAALPSGCVLVANTARNFVNEPRLAISEIQHRRKAEALAWRAWKDISFGMPEASSDFAAGYRDGFADYLISGHTTDVPPAPPTRYQRIVYHTPETLRAVDDYFNGFHTGSTDARASGLRQAMVVPVAVTGPPVIDTLPSPPPAAILPPRADPSTELLPQPRELQGR